MKTSFSTLSHRTLLIAASLVCFDFAEAGMERHQINGALANGTPGVYSPVILPGGAKVYFNASIDHDAASTSEIYQVPATGGAVSLFDEAGYSSFASTADTSTAATLYFHRYATATSPQGLYSKPTGGGAETLIFEGDAMSWKISTTLGIAIVQTRDEHIHKASLSGGSQTQLTPASWGAEPYVFKWEFDDTGAGLVVHGGVDYSNDEVLSINPTTGVIQTEAAVADNPITFAIHTGWAYIYVARNDGIYKEDSASASSVQVSTLVAEDETGLTAGPGTTVLVAATTGGIYDTSIHKVTAAGVTTDLIVSGKPAHGVSYVYPILKLTPDSSRVLFLGDDGTSYYRLYSVSATGGAVTAISSGNIEVDYLDEDTSYEITSDSAHVVYVTDVDDDGYHQLQSNAVTGGAHAALSAESLSLNTGLEMQYDVNLLPDGSGVVFLNDETTEGQEEVYYCAIDGSGKRKLNPLLDSLGDCSGIAISDDSSFVVFTADAAGATPSGTSQLYRVDIGTWASTTLGYGSMLPGNVEYSDYPYPAFSFSPDGNWVVYLAEEGTYGKNELYAAHPDGTNRIQLSGALGGHAYVREFHIAPDSSRVVYKEYNSSTGLYRLHSVAINGGTSVLLSQPGADITDEIAITPDSTAVLFVAASPTDPLSYRLHRVPITGGTITRLDTHDGIGSFGSYNARFIISPDGANVVYDDDAGTTTQNLMMVPIAGGTPQAITTFTTAGSSEDVTFTADGQYLVGQFGSIIYSVPVTGGAATTLTTIPAGRYITNLTVSPDSSTVLVQGDLTTDGVTELYAIPVTGGAMVKLNGALVSSGAVIEYQVAGDSSRVVYQADALVDGEYELYSVQLNGTGRTRLTSLVSGGSVSTYEITPDSAYVIYRADENTDELYGLMRRPITGGAAVGLAGSLSATRDVEDDFHIASDGLHVVFRADINFNDRIQVYSTDFVSLTPKLLNTLLTSDADVKAFAIADHGGAIAYVADQITDDSNELFTAWGVPDTVPIADQVALMGVVVGPLGFTIQDTEIPASSLVVTATSSNTTLLPDANITLGGTGASRTITLTPAAGQWGLTQVTVVISDGVYSVSDTFDVRVIPDPNDPPNNISLSNLNVEENSPLGTIVGEFHAIDPDIWDVHTFTLVAGAGDADNSTFIIASGKLRVAGPIDYELKSSLSIRVRATDFVGAFVEKVFPIAVINLTGTPSEIIKSTRNGQPAPFLKSDFVDKFALLDGGSLQKIRIASLPAHGTLGLMYPETVIDSGFTSPTAIAVADLDKDGLDDVAVVSASGSSLVWEKRLPGPTINFARFFIGSGPGFAGARDVAGADLDKDGDMDIVIACGTANKITWFENDGATPPAFTSRTVLSPANGVSAIAIADIDKDGYLDVVASLAGGGSVLWNRNDGASPPGFVSHVISAIEPGCADVAVGDFNKDNRIDVVVAGATNGEIVWFENVPNVPFPNWTRRVVTATAPGAVSVAVGDFNADGSPDILHGSTGNSTIEWHVNNTLLPPVFATQLVTSTQTGITCVSTTRLDGDLRDDALATSNTDNLVRGWFSKTGTGPLPFFDIDTTAQGASCVVGKDINGNGIAEVFACSSVGSEVSLYVDQMPVTLAQEISASELHKLIYFPTSGYVGKDSFLWEGHDGTSWSLTSAPVTIMAYGDEYWNWLMANFGPSAVMNGSLKSSLWGPSADADGDGRSNILEYSLGGNPNNPSDAGTGLTCYIADDGTGTRWLYGSYPYRRNEPSLIYTIESSTDLTNWHSGTGYFTLQSDTVIDSSFSQAVYKALPDISSVSTLTARLSVTWTLE